MHAGGGNLALVGEAGADDAYAGIAILVGDPDKGGAAGEDAGAAADLGLVVVMDVPVKAEAGSEQHLCLGYLVGRNSVVRGDCGRIEGGIGGGGAVENGHVRTEAIDKLEVIGDFHIVLCIDGEL